MSDTTELAIGDRVSLTVGPPAHGGHCVARVDGGLVIFVRHALPGEQVVAEITETRRGYLRADAVEVVEASRDRVAPPCQYAHPGGCGGCDLQHVSVTGQQDWKAAVVREQLLRLAGLSESEVDALGLWVEPLPGGLLGWRTRLRYTVEDSRAGLLAHRSHRLVPIDRCRIAHPSLQLPDLTSRSWPPETAAVEATTGVTGEVTVRTHPGAALVAGPPVVRETALDRQWRLPPGVFWQGHPAAADALAAAVRELLDPTPGQRAWDLYGGAGLFAAALVQAGARRVTLVESDPAAAEAARENLADLPAVSVVQARVEAALRGRRQHLPRPVDLVVLDPPRAGAGGAVVRGIMAARPRAVAYVACDPAAFARDLRTFRDSGWSLAALRALDCFPMTHHVELVALLTPRRRGR